MNSPLFGVLTDFSAPKQAEAPISVLLKRPAPAKTADAMPEAQAKPKPDPAAEQAAAIEKAAAAARAEERDASEKKLAEAIEAENARFRDELAAERLRWAETEAAQLSERFGTAFKSLETLISDQVANVLGPFLADAYRQQMVLDLKEIIRTMLADGPAGMVAVSGPEDLLAALKASLGDEMKSIEFQASETVDVCAIASETAVETLLKPWSDRLNDVLKAV